MSVSYDALEQALEESPEKWYALCREAAPHMQLEITSEGEEVYVPRSLILSTTDKAQNVHATIS
jgi:hypothetical protein